MGAGGGADGPCESLYFSPHEDDVLLSCASRLLSERASGAKVRVVVVFSSSPSAEPSEAGQALLRLGVAVTRLGLAPAPERNDFYRTFSRTCFERHSEDDRLLGELAERISDLAIRARARQVYLPLGAGGHVDHRLLHEAGLRALHDGTGRNVFFYEERPQAFLPGAIRIRLGELGARLPPAAVDIHDDPTALRAFLGFAFAPFLKAERLGVAERVRAARCFLASLRAARVWRPTRAFGLRVQPVLDRLERSEFEGALRALAAAEPRVTQLFGSLERLESDSRRYAERLGCPPHAERYWLLLPPRDEGGLVELPMAGAGGASE